ncbi:MAG: DMT family transporter [Deltaproteobacteria bacterium]|jgi:uncharacterized membrane protein YdcZ (DUF606 family)
MGSNQTRQLTDSAQQIKASIDHFGFFGAAVRPMEMTRLPGFCSVLLGVWLVVK